MANKFLIQIVNVVTYIFLLGSNVYGTLQPYGKGAQPGKTTYISPAGYAFYVWTLINLGLLGEVIMQFFQSGEIITEVIGWNFAITAVINAIFVHLWSGHSYILAFIASLFLASAVSAVYWSLRSNPPKTSAQTLFVHAPWSLWHAWSVVLVVLSIFGAFGVEKPKHHAGVGTEVCVIIGLVFLASTSVGYAFNGDQGDIAGAAVIAWALLGVFSAQQHPTLIHYFSLGCFVVSALAVVKAASTAFRSGSGSVLNDNERAPLLGGSN